jgi:hypothetical protein
MVKQDPDDVQREIDKQNADFYGEDYHDQDVGDIDESLKDITGDEPDLDSPSDFVSKQIMEDQESVNRGVAPIGSDVSEDDFEDDEEEKEPEIDSGIIEASTDTSEE